VVEVKYSGRFGNNLFQYVLGRIIAEELGYYMSSYQGQEKENFTYSQREIKGYKIDNPVKTYKGHKIDLYDILTNKDPRKIVLDGYFQRYEYFAGYRKKIQNWLELADIDFNPEPNDVFLHIRRSDFGLRHNGGMLSLNFYSDILNNNSFNKIYISGGCSHIGNRSDIDNKVI
jgi:hypothetical protein